MNCALVAQFIPPFHLLPTTLTQPIDRLELPRQVTHKKRWIRSLARNQLHQRLRLVNHAKGVHLLTQPIQDKGGIASSQPLIEIRECLAQRRVNLRSVEISQRVTWKVAKARSPVNI